MPDDPRVQELIEEILDSGRSAEEVCRDSPELLPRVRQEWRRFRAVRARVGALFPETESFDDRAGWPTLPDDSNLPEIPGYEVQVLLGHGGMGVVYRARQLSLNRLVALKMMIAGAYAGPAERGRFQREAEAVAGLQHPNVVQIHEVGESAGHPYFTMEYLEGGSLAQELSGRPQPARQAAELLATLAGAVQVAHQGGVVHRDLKPSNVLLTADGIPKISDFGLARRLDGGAGQTRSGLVIGTPSYMAPEQARGDTTALGPAVDVYALGAILYELLTGRPPFRADSAAETVQQVISREPVPPSRLNSKLPRDLEIICLKCLRKEPTLRYAGASALADDLYRFLRGEAIEARPEGSLARLARRVRRRPALWASISVALLLMAILAGGGLWLILERAKTAREARAQQVATERAAEEDLRDMVRCEEKASWLAANAALDRVRGRLGDRGSPELRRRMEQGARELELVARLDANRMARAASVGGRLAIDRTIAELRRAFKEAGLGEVGEDPKVVASRVRASAIRSTLVAMLDDGALHDQNPTQRDWLLAVARLADDDPTGWRNLARDPANRESEEALAKLLETAPMAGQSVPFLLALQNTPKASDQVSIRYLKRVQHAHPDDFWANLVLGQHLVRTGQHGESLRYLQAALALRPGAGIVHNDIGNALNHSGRSEEAVTWLRQAIQFDPTAAAGHHNLARSLYSVGQYDEAIEQSQLAARLMPRTAVIYATLGWSLEAKGRTDEAIAAYRQVLALKPNDTDVQKRIRELSIRQGRMDEARVAWAAILEARPSDHDNWYGYAELCLYLGREDDYRRARRELLDKFAKITDPFQAERTSRACLLLPASDDELREIVALGEHAWSVKPSKFPGVYRHFLFVEGLAEYRQEHLERAIALMRGETIGVLGPAPGLVLAMALHKSGRADEARKSLAAAVLSHDWRTSQVKDQDDWIYHSLRREAESLILPDLAAFLEGKHQPRYQDERLALLGVCQAKDRTVAMARLYADAFAADPQMVPDLAAGHRYRAARVAALAGSGRGVDAAGLSELDRGRWRQQARQWLRADLAAWAEMSEDEPSKSRDQIRRTLENWKGEPDLASLRDPAELEKLAIEERKDCLALWAETNALLKTVESIK